MSVVQLGIHNVSRVTTETRVVKTEAGDAYTVRDLVIHYADNYDRSASLRLTLCGLRSLQGAMSIPIQKDDAQ